MNTMETIFSRASVRSYTGQPVTPEELALILKAAKAAPAGMARFDTLHLTVIHNRADDLRLKRIINTPARGLGPKAIETAERLARAEGKSLYHVIEKPQDYAPLEKPAAKMRAFAENTAKCGKT